MLFLPVSFFSSCPNYFGRDLFITPSSITSKQNHECHSEIITRERHVLWIVEGMALSSDSIFVCGKQ